MIQFDFNFELTISILKNFGIEILILHKKLCRSDSKTFLVLKFSLILILFFLTCDTSVDMHVVLIPKRNKKWWVMSIINLS